jgi:phosphosulfolactate synthase (CoM biosynthesis protein A)
VELSTGFITVPVDDVLKLVKQVKDAGLKAKPEVGIQFGAGGASSAAEPESSRLEIGQFFVPKNILTLEPT